MVTWELVTLFSVILICTTAGYIFSLKSHSHDDLATKDMFLTLETWLEENTKKLESVQSNQIPHDQIQATAHEATKLLDEVKKLISQQNLAWGIRGPRG